MFDLTGKTALVTGASGGIGHSIATALYQQGAKIVCTGRNKESLEALAKQLGDRAVVMTADLSSAETITNLIKQVNAEVGAVDILVNNAGLTRDTLAMRMKDEDWQAVLDVNLTAAFRLSRAVMKAMMKKRWGRIISISSVVGATGNAGQANYAASKAGLVGLSKSLAQELAPRNITVNCIAPGFIKTAMTDKLSEEIREKWVKNIPAGRFGTGEDIAHAAVFLASEEASYLTGTVLHVNGGMAMI